MGRRLALLIATYQYEDPEFRQLTAPAHDAEALAAVLRDPDIAGFEVTTLVNEPYHRVGEAIGALYRDRCHDDLTLLYFTGHGMKDDDGRLYLAMTNTRRDGLLFTGIAAEQIDQAMDGCVSRQKVLVLDCCYSGAFPADRIAKADTAVNTFKQFRSRGRTVLTASDATQYSFEGNQVRGQAVQSVFTRYLVAGLRDGSADLDGDGDITLDELYTYVHDRVVAEMPQQRPKKQSTVEGRAVIAKNVNWTLPVYLSHVLASPIANVRLSSLDGLDHLYRIGNDTVRARVTEEIRRLADDDSRAVTTAAAGWLQTHCPGAPDLPTAAVGTVEALVPSQRAVPGPPVAHRASSLPRIDEGPAPNAPAAILDPGSDLRAEEPAVALGTSGSAAPPAAGVSSTLESPSPGDAEEPRSLPWYAKLLIAAVERIEETAPYGRQLLGRWPIAAVGVAVIAGLAAAVLVFYDLIALTGAIICAATLDWSSSALFLSILSVSASVTAGLLMLAYWAFLAKSPDGARSLTAAVRGLRPFSPTGRASRQAWRIADGPRPMSAVLASAVVVGCAGVIAGTAVMWWLERGTVADAWQRAYGAAENPLHVTALSGICFETAGVAVITVLILRVAWFIFDGDADSGSGVVWLIGLTALGYGSQLGGPYPFSPYSDESAAASRADDAFVAQLPDSVHLYPIIAVPAGVALILIMNVCFGKWRERARLWYDVPACAGPPDS
ncbi:caspase family protein [Actinoplanes regularis]|uniref:caspase family protein n=1 Tax=Actinoplanes regularis TaxID=52697 RepID=UPI0024A34C5E|nr:caspase family protein [Actinoplanes regularis]GLW34985.1 hypothetical protein Areg01_79210 [Actinoplanes regularis]